MKDYQTCFTTPELQDTAAAARAQTLLPAAAGACSHALGYCRQAVEDYQACFMTSEGGLDSEARGLIYLGFYQKELALHMAANLDRPVSRLCIDREIDPVFKVLLTCA